MRMSASVCHVCVYLIFKMSEMYRRADQGTMLSTAIFKYYINKYKLIRIKYNGIVETRFQMFDKQKYSFSVMIYSTYTDRKELQEIELEYF